MKKPLLVLLALLCVGVAARFLYRCVVQEIDWRTDRAVQLSVLQRAEKHRQTAETFRNYPAGPNADWHISLIINDLNQLAETEVIDAKQELLRLYEHRTHLLLSTEEAAQVAQWQKDVAAWKAVNVRP